MSGERKWEVLADTRTVSSQWLSTKADVYGLGTHLLAPR